MVMDAPLPSFPPQDNKMKPMVEMMIKNTTNNCSPSSSIIKATKKDVEALNCPRCNSSNTKFCYYNNYSQTQPRYFCKACKRYWTQGGSLRSIPVGGKIRKNKRQSSYASSSSASNASKIKLRHDLIDHHQQQQYSSINPNPKLSLFNHAQDLNNNDHISFDHYKNSTHSFNPSYLSPMASFMGMALQNQNPNPNSVYPVGYPFHGEFRAPSLGFSLDDFGSVDQNKGEGDNHQQDHIGDQMSTRNHDHQHEDSTDFWNGNILGGGGSW